MHGSKYDYCPECQEAELELFHDRHLKREMKEIQEIIWKDKQKEIQEQVGNVAKPDACPQLYDAEATREKLASYAHKQWSRWMEYLFSKCEIPIHHTQAGLIIPPWAVERWKRQIETPYEELSEPEKESDRKEADGMLEIICRSFI